jgi:hypothetical protein
MPKLILGVARPLESRAPGVEDPADGVQAKAFVAFDVDRSTKPPPCRRN